MTALLILVGRESAQALARINICVLDTGKGSDHEKRVLTVLQRNLKDCSICRVITHPIYDIDGNLTSTNFNKALDAALSSCDLVNLSWNTLSTPQTKMAEEKLGQIAAKKVLIAASGATENGLAKALDATVLGHVDEAFLIGELDHKGRLDLHGFYGPRIFTALPTDDAFMGSSFTAPQFTAAVALWMQRHPAKSLNDLKSFLRTQRQKSSEKYPSLKSLGL